MLRCPLPPVAEWGELLKARAALLQQRGLSPQLFLPAASLRGTQDAKAGSLTPLLWRPTSAMQKAQLWLHAMRELRLLLRMHLLLPSHLHCGIKHSPASGPNVKSEHCSVVLMQGQKGNAGDRLQRLLPPAAWETLEALVMEPPQLLQELEAAEQSGSQGPAPSMSNGMSAIQCRLAACSSCL